MGKVFGVVACLGLVTTTAWCVDRIEAAEPQRTATGPATAASTGSGKDRFAYGKQAHLQGRHAEAAAALQTALDSGELSPADQALARQYLTRARARLGALPPASESSGRPIVRAQSEELTPTEAKAAARKLLANAKAAAKRGDIAGARAMAQRAAAYKGVKWADDEESPARFLAILEATARRAGQTDMTVAARGEGKNEGSAFTRSQGITAKRDTLGRRSAAQTAAKMMEQARKLFEDGDYDAAEELAVKCQELGPQALNALVEDTPDLLLADIDDMRRQASRSGKKPVSRVEPGEVRTAASDGTDDDSVMQVADADFDDAVESPAPKVAAAPKSKAAGNSRDALRLRCDELMSAAQSALEAGDLTTAHRKALAAQQMVKKTGMTFAAHEATPDDMLAAIRSASSLNIAGKGQPKTKPIDIRSNSDVAAADPTEDSEADLDSQASVQEATELTKQARAALQAGQIDVAKDLASQAAAMDVAFDAFADRPDLVLADIERTTGNRTTGNRTAGNRTAGKGASPNRGGNVAAADDDVRSAALALVKEAQADLKAGRHAEARAKAIQARKMDATFDVFEEDPEQILEEIARSEARGPASRRLAMADRDEAPAARVAGDSDEDFGFSKTAMAEADLELTPGEGLPGDTSVEDLAVIHPAGKSARELIKQGEQAMRSRNRDRAYQLFLRAYESGEELDRATQSRLRDYLTQLNPRHKGVIQQTQGLAFDADAIPDAAQGIDEVAERQQVAFQALRTEVLNTVFKAEKLAESDPDAALQLIDKALLQVESSELNRDSLRQLVKVLSRSRENVESQKRVYGPYLADQKRNKDIKETIKNERRQKVVLQQEYADGVEKFNELMDQKRYAEAELLAKKLRALDPENPIGETMVWKSKLARRIDSNEQLKDNKEEAVWKALDNVEQGLVFPNSDISYAKDWKELSRRRKDRFPKDGNIPEQDRRIYRNLEKEVSVHFDEKPLGMVLKHIADLTDVNFHPDMKALEEVGVNLSETKVAIDLDGVKARTVLKLILEQIQAAYVIRDGVVKVTSSQRAEGDLYPLTYDVSDLVIGAPSGPSPDSGGDGSLNSLYSKPYAPMPGVNASSPFGGALGSNGQAPRIGGSASQSFAAIPASPIGPATHEREKSVERSIPSRGGSGADPFPLMDLIMTTVGPETWQDTGGGNATIRWYDNALSLVILQTQRRHDEIADLLAQLRRLQDLQVTVEVRFITVNDRFFERIGIDFDFSVYDNVGGPDQAGFGQPFPPFGTGTRFIPVPGVGVAGAAGVGAAGVGAAGVGAAGVGAAGVGAAGAAGAAGVAGVAGAAAAATGVGGVLPFAPGPPRDLVGRNNYPKYGSILGLLPNNTFPNDLNVPFRQGSFGVGVPRFGNFNAEAGLQVGMAILSDIETFFLINAAQGDERNNLLFAPKVTLFNGRSASVNNTLTRPFVIGMTPVVGFAAVGFNPIIRPLNEGVQLTVQAVISADRRYVRIMVMPMFNAITDVFTFTFATGGAGGGAGIAGVGGVGGGVGGVGGGVGGVGGAGAVGVGGIGGFGAGGFGGAGGAGGGIGGGAGIGGGGAGIGAGGAAGAAGAAAGGLTIQQPVQEQVFVMTTVSVPDNGTVLLGGIKRLREGRVMAGVPILNKIPWISRLFKNSGVGRETESLMMMVTPRIIIQEEEEELLGIP